VLSDSEVQRVLVMLAHPDDVDFGSAGTVARWTDAGISVAYCIVTDGDAGGHDESVPRTEIAPMRRKEQTAAAACVGVHDLRFLGYPDGSNYMRMPPSHPDHRAVGSAALDAVYPDARNPFAFPELRTEEGLEAWTVREVWMQGGPALNQYVDITETFSRKVAALRAHESQTGHMDKLEEFLRGWLSRAAAQGGLPEGRLAEAFQVIDTA